MRMYLYVTVRFELSSQGLLQYDVLVGFLGFQWLLQL